MCRAGAVHGDVMRVFQALGIADELLLSMHTQQVQFVSSDGKPVFVLPVALGPDGHPQVMFHFQPEVERVLRRTALETGHVTLLAGHEVVHVATRSDGSAAVRVAATPGSPCGCAVCGATLSARIAVGCDGGRSTVRRLLNIPLVGSSFSQRVRAVPGLLSVSDCVSL